jgi:hypothetical protein
MIHVSIGNLSQKTKRLRQYAGSVRSILISVINRTPSKSRAKGVLSPVTGSVWSIGTSSKGLGIDESLKVRLKRNQIRKGFAKWPKWWENGLVHLSNYGGEDRKLASLVDPDALFRVIEVRNNKKSGKCAEEKRRNFKDMLFLEPVGSPGMYKVYAGEAWVELVVDPPPEFEEPEDEEWQDLT